MRATFFSLCLMALATVTFAFVGCDRNSSKTPDAGVTGKSSSQTDTLAHDDHAGHDHGDAGHGHAEEGPHGGHLIELGDEEYHAELLHNEKTHTVTIHLLDGPAKQTVAVPAKEIIVHLFQDGQFLKYTLKAAPQPKDPTDAASRFKIVDAELCDALAHGDETRGRLQVTIKGKPYTGTIQHDSHGDRDHDGDDHAGHDQDGDDRM